MTTQTQQKTIILAGATGDLGGRIARALVRRGATVKALARRESDLDAIVHLRGAGVVVEKVDFDNIAELVSAMQGASCVVSVLSGLRKVMIRVQTNLLTAAVEACVPRFIPSDFSLDFTKTSEGTNRNLNLRREFRVRLDAAPIAATSILNGMFADLLTGEAPLILFSLNRIVYWGNADQPLDFMIKATRTLMPAEAEVLPPWQGMQYLHNMLSGRGKLDPLDTHRYPEIRFTTVRDVVEARQ